MSESDVTCPECGSGTVHRPAQTCDMPMYLRCRSCGEQRPTAEMFVEEDTDGGE